MNCPRYVKPAGIGPAPPPARIIALAIRLRFGSPSWRFTPLGPIREKRNGGVASATEAAAATPAPSGTRPLRPPTLSLRSPSPRTK